jgi:hypothetical protein
MDENRHFSWYRTTAHRRLRRPLTRISREQQGVEIVHAVLDPVHVGWGGATAEAWRFAPQRPTPGPERTDRRWSFGLTPYTLGVLPSTCHGPTGSGG